MSPRHQRWLLKLGEYFNSIHNIEEHNLSMITIQSVDKNLFDHFPIKEEIVNKYKTQIILTNNKTYESKTLHGKRIIYIAECYFNTMGDIFRNYITKGKQAHIQDFRIILTNVGCLNSRLTIESF